jgi:hypothetical protein
MGREAAKLQQQLAAYQFSRGQATAGLLAPRTPIRESAAWLDAALRSLQLFDVQLAANDLANAAVSAQRATRALRLIELAYWQAATKMLQSPITSPAAVRFDTLPLHWRFRDRIMTSRYGPNLLPGGDFEDLGTMLRAGWQHIQQPTPNVQSAADLVPDAAHSGRLGLRVVSPILSVVDDPSLPTFDREIKAPLATFKANLLRMGGKFVEISASGSLTETIHRLFPAAKVFCSAAPEFAGNRPIEQVRAPAELHDVDDLKIVDAAQDRGVELELQSRRACRLERTARSVGKEG